MLSPWPNGRLANVESDQLDSGGRIAAALARQLDAGLAADAERCS